MQNIRLAWCLLSAIVLSVPAAAAGQTSPQGLIQAVEVVDGGRILVGTNSNGVYSSEDNGTSWTQVGLQGQNIRAIRTGPDGHLYAAVSGWGPGGLFRSRDGGRQWMRVGPSKFGMDLAFSPSGRVYLATKGGSILEYQDEEAHSIGRGLAMTSLGAVAIDRSGRIFAGSEGGGIYFSSDGGANWQRPRSGMREGSVRAIATGPGVVLAGTNRGVFRSDDDGETWSQINGGLLTPQVETLLITDAGAAFAGTNGGLYRLDSATSRWQNVLSSELGVHAIGFGSGQGVIAVSSQPFGVWRDEQAPAVAPVVRIQQTVPPVTVGGFQMEIERCFRPDPNTVRCTLGVTNLRADQDWSIDADSRMVTAAGSLHRVKYLRLGNREARDWDVSTLMVTGVRTPLVAQIEEVDEGISQLALIEIRDGTQSTVFQFRGVPVEPYVAPASSPAPQGEAGTPQTPVPARRVAAGSSRDSAPIPSRRAAAGGTNPTAAPGGTIRAAPAAASAGSSLTAQMVSGLWIPLYQRDHGVQRYLRLDAGGTYEIYETSSQEGFVGRVERRRSIGNGRFRLREGDRGQLICFEDSGNRRQSSGCGRVRMPTPRTILWDWAPPRFGAEQYRRPGTRIGG